MEDSLFANPDSFSGGKEFGFKQLVLNQVSKILSLGSKEFRGGYWQERIQRSGGVDVTSKVYIPDSRAEYTNAVNSLFDLLHNRFDSTIKKQVEELEKEKFENKDQEVIISRRLFLALCDFLHRLNWLDALESGE